MSLVPLSRPRTGQQAFFRYRDLGKHVVLTNLEGRFLTLDRPEFELFSRSEVPVGTPLHEKLRTRNFLRDSYDIAAATTAFKARRTFVGTGPNLHILVVTLRCNETCVYCHSSRAVQDESGVDMTPETARKAVDVAFRSPSPSLTFEFQGGEPLLNFPVMQEVVRYALEKNREIGKTLEFTLISNLGLMTEETLAWLLEHKVQICTSIDGPKHLHDHQRKLPGLSAFDAATFWIKRINQAYADAGLDTNTYHVEALLTTTRASLPLWKEIVDTYVDLGCKAMFLRPLDPFGFADKTGPRVDYPRAEYLAYYANAVDYMLELNARGVQVLERFAAIFLTKILGQTDPNYLDIRSPCGAGIGQVAYNYDGSVYSCDEGRMLREMGDESFKLGTVDTPYRTLLAHDVLPAIAMASNLDAQPDCVNCAYNPYCGICPVHNHKTQGNIFGRMRESTLCAVHKGIQDYLFRKLAEADPQTLETFRRWTTVRNRDHFWQDT